MDLVGMVTHLLLITLLCHVTCIQAQSMSCDLLYVKSVAFACNSHLSQIQVEVLAGSYGQYTRVCRAFEEYINCLEPNIGYCKKDQYLTVREYFNEKAKFSGAPYNCTVPQVAFTFKGLKKQVAKDKMPSSPDVPVSKAHSLEKLPLLVTVTMCIILSAVS